MRLQRYSNAQIITLAASSVLGHGGEGRVYGVSEEQTLVAKVYHRPSAAQVRKLKAMLANPPENPMAEFGKISIAWPVDLLTTTGGNSGVVGFLMPRVTGMRSIVDFYNPRTRREKSPSFSYLYLHRTARNLAAAVKALHKRGYCIGDVNESNILVSETALVTLVDTDSFQVPERESNVVYRCGVGKPELTPPELQGKNFGELDRVPENDLFGLAVLIFQLLMEGTHPFSGIYRGSGEPPPYEARIKAGHFTYSKVHSVPYRASPTAPPFEILHPTIQQLFVRCFEQGHEQPQLRPTAQDWQTALDEAEQALIVCSVNSNHRYGKHLSTCPWCERTRILGGRDPFPSREEVKTGKHLRPLKPKKAAPVVTSALPHPVHRAGLNRPRAVFITKPARRRKNYNPHILMCLCIIPLIGIVSEILLTSGFGAANLKLNNSPSITSDNIDLSMSDSPNNSLQSDSTYFNQGNAYYRIGDYEAAIEKFSQALHSNPQDAKSYIGRGQAHAQLAQTSNDPQRDYNDAISDFSHALSLNPQNADAYVNLGNIYYEIAQSSIDPAKDYKAALNSFDQALRLNSQDVAAYVSRGDIRYRLAQFSGDSSQGFKAAIADLDQALRLDPQNAGAYVKRGVIRYESAQFNSKPEQEYQAALMDLKKASGIFLQRRDINHYQQTLGNICMVLENNCTTFLQNQNNFVSGPGNFK